jgi:rubrerythrin
MTSIIQQAIHLENTAETHYREAAKRTSDSSAAHILRLLADEEARHAGVLRGMNHVTHLKQSRLLDQAATWIHGVVEGGLPAISSDADLVEVLRRAMDIEQMTESFYREHAAAAEDHAIADLFEALGDIEKGHFLLVGSLVEYFSRPSEWVESAEFGLRSEY